jgi:hypothetical protein
LLLRGNRITRLKAPLIAEVLDESCVHRFRPPAS